ncbi:MAG: aminotransferase class I/II-fold pyridoxal phosphate-dependent enzyme [Ruminococcaceae bacterium]|nr:aminotransferase class I/II-fold pyridoxal phosphate-dependent enzyme [Oscillospiraceae bacterium]
MNYLQMSPAELKSEYEKVSADYSEIVKKGLKLDMSRGKPCKAQLDLTNEMLNTLSASDSLCAENGFDCRNYGILDGIPEAKKLFAPVLGVSEDEIVIFGNSSLNIMYDTIIKAMQFGIMGNTPWCKLDKVKFLCPVPGYDRHFAVCQAMGIEMINVPMKNDGPDMDIVEKLVAQDDSIKGIWCVPKYSNPDGITYSDTVVKRMANLSPKAKDFRIFWDNAYAIHDFSDPDTLMNIFDELKKNGKQDMIFMFGSTSKVTFPGAGVAFMGASQANLEWLKKLLFFQTIGHDKINQLRHVRFFKTYNNIIIHMKKHAEILMPKFDIVCNTLESKLKVYGLGNWKRPNGGYFVSLFLPGGCAKRTAELCKQAGVVLTGAGATYPYGIDPDDSNLRISPSFPPNDELQQAMNVLCLCARLAYLEQKTK